MPCAAPFVKFMVDNLEKRGCKVTSPNNDFFVVRHCDEQVGGGFDESASKHGGVVLCQNHIRDFSHTGVCVCMRAQGDKLCVSGICSVICLKFAGG